MRSATALPAGSSAFATATLARCGELGLRLRSTPEQTKLDFAVLLTVQTMNYLHSGRHRVAL